MKTIRKTILAATVAALPFMLADGAVAAWKGANGDGEGKIISVSPGDKTVRGTDADDRFIAWGGKPKMDGKKGNDVFEFAGCGMKLKGGAGADRFVLGTGCDEAKNPSIILDFRADKGDVIDLTTIDSDASKKGIQRKWTYVGGKKFKEKVFGQVRLAKGGMLLIDTDGKTEKPEIVLKLKGVTSLPKKALVLKVQANDPEPSDPEPSDPAPTDPAPANPAP